MIVIPAIDILGGECVRLKRGDFSDKKSIPPTPSPSAKEFERQGAGMLHIVDLDGAKTGRPANTEIIRAIKNAVAIPVEVGGGIRSAAVAKEYLAFADRIVLGTKALEDIPFIGTLIKEFGSGRIVVALELKDGKLATEGWQRTSAKAYMEFVAELKKSALQMFSLPMYSATGMQTEPNYDIALALVAAGVNVIAFGGVSGVTAIKRLSEIGVAGAIIGTALYEKKLTLQGALEAARPISNLTKRIIPCLDVKDGKVVKGVSFENLQDVGDPVSSRKKYSDEGADELVFLDISASSEGRETMFDVVGKVAKEVFIPFTVGGGISSIRTDTQTPPALARTKSLSILPQYKIPHSSAKPRAPLASNAWSSR